MKIQFSVKFPPLHFLPSVLGVSLSCQPINYSLPFLFEISVLCLGFFLVDGDVLNRCQKKALINVADLAELECIMAIGLLTSIKGVGTVL